MKRLTGIAQLVTFVLATALVAAGCGGSSDEKLAASRDRAKEQEKLTHGEGGAPAKESTDEEKPADDEAMKAEDEKPADDKMKEEPKETETKGDPANGKSVFTSTCGGCHALSDAGTSGAVGPKLDGLKLTFDTVLTTIKNGKGTMPPGLLSGTDADDTAAYVAEATAK